MKTTIYACYLPGSTTPDYIGSHQAEPPARSDALKWRYANCRYMGQGAWIDPTTGALITMPVINSKTLWGAYLLSLSPAQLLAVRIEVLASVESGMRWKTEARFLRNHRPRFNALLPQSAEVKRQKWNAYCKSYRPAYYARNPDKAQAKRDKDRARIAAKRAALKAATDPANVA
jgi:hypothetical protein